MDSSTHRVISISLNEQDWQAFVRVHPQPVNWLREQIQESIANSVAMAAPPPSAATAAPPSAAAAANTTSATTR